MRPVCLSIYSHFSAGHHHSTNANGRLPTLPLPRHSRRQSRPSLAVHHSRSNPSKENRPCNSDKLFQQTNCQKATTANLPPFRQVTIKSKLPNPACKIPSPALANTSNCEWIYWGQPIKGAFFSATRIFATSRKRRSRSTCSNWAT